MRHIMSALFMVIVLLLGLPLIASAQGQEPAPSAGAALPLTVQINGLEVNAPAEIDVAEGQVMVPLRWAAEQLGASSVEWDSENRTITIRTGQDFYHLEKLTSYVRALASGAHEQNEEICPLPAKGENLSLSYDVPNREWVLELDQNRGQPTGPNLPYDPIYIRITSDDGLYEHSSLAYSAENRHGHYYLPMDWLEYLFHALVDYNEATQELSIQTADINKVKSEIALIEQTLLPTSAEVALKLYGRGLQTRNGALQYAALSPQLRQAADKSYHVRQNYWVTGFSSPWVGPISIESREIIDDTKVEYTISFPQVTSAPPHTNATERLVVDKLAYNGGEGWFITQILQSSDYGIIAREADYTAPQISDLLAAIKASRITDEGDILITDEIKLGFNKMGEDYRFFFMPEVAWYDFESTGAAISYMLFTWTGEFGNFPEEVAPAQAEARLRKIFAAPDNNYPQLKHQNYPKFVRFSGTAYSLWPESYNADTMVYDLIELKERKDGADTYYTATADEYGFDVNGYYQPGANEKLLAQESQAWGLDYNSTLNKLLTNGQIIQAEKGRTYVIEFRIANKSLVPTIVSVKKNHGGR